MQFHFITNALAWCVGEVACGKRVLTEQYRLRAAVTDMIASVIRSSDS